MIRNLEFEVWSNTGELNNSSHDLYLSEMNIEEKLMVDKAEEKLV